MRNIACVGVLMLALSTPANALSTNRCEAGLSAKLSDNKIDAAGLVEPLRQFSRGIERAQKYYRVKGKIGVVVLGCGFYHLDVLSIKLFNAIPLIGLEERYRVYVSAHLLKYEQDSLEHTAIMEVCKIKDGLDLPLIDDEGRQQERLRAKRCMAEMVNDAELLRWLDRISPDMGEGWYASVSKQLDEALESMGIPPKPLR